MIAVPAVSPSRSVRSLGPWIVALALLAALPGAVAAQPFGAWLTLAGEPTDGYVSIPDSAALRPTGSFTIEAWVAIRDDGSCSSIVGKQWTQSWWVGVCGTALRSYVKGYDDNPAAGRHLRQAGTVPPLQWTHVAVVYNGTQRRHLINGEQVGVWPETGPLFNSDQEVRIGSDVAFTRTPQGAIDEVRFWNVARSTEQIRANLNKAITTPQLGLAAVWSLNGSGADVVGPHEGTVHGSGTGFLTFPVAADCGTNTATSLCLLDRFSVNARFRVGGPGTAEGVAHTVNVVNEGSGLFWFFSPDNWEIMVKAIDACVPVLGNRFWIFSAATTNVFYRVEVTDVHGAQKIYFNYPGPPAPAVTDTAAFATCP